MGEFISRGAALGTSIPALVLGSLGFVQSGGLGGGLGGILGGGNAQAAMMASAVGQGVLSEKDATIARLMSEKYADKVGTEVYAQSRRENQDLSDRLLGNWIKPLSQEAAANRERIAVLETQVQADREKAALREQILTDKIDCVGRESAHGIQNVGMGLAALRQTVDGITRTIIPQTAICPPVMPRFNAFQTPTNNAPDTQPINGTVNVAQ